jgi:hypothetical protein
MCGNHLKHWIAQPFSEQRGILNSIAEKISQAIRAGGTRSMYRRAGRWARLRHSPIESLIEGREVAMAKGQKRSNKEKKKPKQDRNKKKGGEAPSPFAVKLGTSYMNQYGKKD